MEENGISWKIVNWGERSCDNEFNEFNIPQGFLLFGQLSYLRELNCLFVRSVFYSNRSCTWILLRNAFSQQS